jgi:transposase
VTSPACPDGFRRFVCLIKRTSFALRLCCRLHEPIVVRSHHNVVTPWLADRKPSARAVVSCRWLWFEMEWTGGEDRGRDWIHRFNASGPDGLIDKCTEGPKPRLSEEQLAQFAKIVEAGPDREKNGVVRWRRLDLKCVIAERFGVDFHTRYVGKLLRKLGFSHISARPRHPMQDERIVEAFKKLPPALKAHLEGRSETTPMESRFR